MDWIYFLVYAIIGAVAGLFSGLLGIGGGILAGPLLLQVFLYQGIATDQAALMAVSTSAGSVFLTSLPSTTVHALHKKVRWRALVWLAPFAIIGSVIGATIARQASAFVLVAAMLTLILYSISSMLRKRAEPTGSVANGSQQGIGLKLALIGSVAGSFGAISGTGGGILVTPLLFRTGFLLKHAIGTSAATTAMVATGSLLGFAGVGLSIKALTAIAVTSLICAALGARLTAVLPIDIIRKIYVVFLLVVLLRTLYWVSQQAGWL